MSGRTSSKRMRKFMVSSTVVALPHGRNTRVWKRYSCRSSSLSVSTNCFTSCVRRKSHTSKASSVSTITRFSTPMLVTSFLVLMISELRVSRQMTLPHSTLPSESCSET